MRRQENYGLSSCHGSVYCVDCGGVCSQDSVANDNDTPVGLWVQKPVEIPGPDYLDRYRNYLRSYRG